jgi:hypothetical protein
VAKIARIPPKNVSKDDAEVLKDLDGSLKRVVFGQDDAIVALSSAIKLARAGLREPEKPIGNYLFAGPTGVGKTEVAKQLAATWAWSSCASTCRNTWRSTRLRLIGAPPGYVGFDQGGSSPTAWTSTPLRPPARRDREGASGRLQHPPAGDGPRQAHRPQRPGGGLPQRDPDHDLERGRRRHGREAPSASAATVARARTPPPSSGCSRPSSATASTP